jgi:hypothetical protein
MGTIPGPKKEQQTEGKGKFHTEDLHHFYSLIYDIKLIEIKTDGAYSAYG